MLGSNITSEQSEGMNFNELVELETACFEAYKNARDLFEKIPRNADGYWAAATEKNRLYDLYIAIGYKVGQAGKDQ